MLWNVVGLWQRSGLCFMAEQIGSLWSRSEEKAGQSVALRSTPEGHPSAAQHIHQCGITHGRLTIATVHAWYVI